MLRRRMMMELLKGDENLKYGYFDVEYDNSEPGLTVQVNRDIYIDVDTGLKEIPKKIICFLFDERTSYNANGIYVFCGDGVSNSVNSNLQSEAENIAFTNTGAQYFNYNNGMIRIKIPRWKHLCTGKYMWVAV